MIGRQLARIGDEIGEKYDADFAEMITILNNNADTGYDAFANVTRR